MKRTVRDKRGAGGPATIHDVANAAGVSIATVSRVLAGNYPVAEATRVRVLKAVTKLDYTANVHARRLLGVAPGPIAVLLGDITGPSFAALARGVEREAYNRERLCLIGTTDGDPERELALVETMRQQQAAAVILPGGAWDLDEYPQQMARYARSLRAVGGRIVLCGRPPLDEPAPNAISVRYDNEAGAAAVARVPLQAGHRRFLLLPGPAGLSTAEERLAGYRSALTGAEVLVRRAEFHREAAREAVLAALDEHPTGFTAVLCGTDVMAAGALEGLRSRGLRCPEDVSVTGYDDIPGARDMNPALTTVRVPYEEMGALAVTLALAESAPATQLLETRVVIRDSVAPPA
ncbi:LacI family DNA-binding transcriptional regulator [Actinoplanes sp. NPDC026670]|uniref:LacI family DNA-binding transcriptional regulator n=1 Tax=Actinoplanes sp. NPDC026670 TaxID=3154700 RepID=UPI0033F28515